VQTHSHYAVSQDHQKRGNPPPGNFANHFEKFRVEVPGVFKPDLRRVRRSTASTTGRTFTSAY
jgi:hypothetical protein